MSENQAWKDFGVKGRKWGVNMEFLFLFYDAWFAQDAKSMEDMSYSKSHRR